MADPNPPPVENPPPHLLPELTYQLEGGRDLSTAEAESAALAMTGSAPSPDVKGAFLRALVAKGETPAEVGAFARVFRGLALRPELGPEADNAIDVVGTGGDGSGTFNFSTATALFLAALGQPVIKHGNRSVTSRSGSADLLRSLGVPLENDPTHLCESFDRFRFCFLFAPAFHPAFKEVMPVRQQLAEEGTRTIFNILGPLINPAQPPYALLGVFSHAWVRPLAAALDELGTKAALVVHCRTSEGGDVDELTVSGQNEGVGSGRLRGTILPSDPAALGLEPAPLSALRGGDAGENLRLLEDLAAGRASAPFEDTLCLNTGAGLWISGKVPTLAEGITLARQELRRGTFQDWLTAFRNYLRSLPA